MNDHVEASARDNVLLVDLENCPRTIEQLQDNLRAYTKVVICYATTGAVVPLDWLVPLSTTIETSRLKIHKMQFKGKNASDFGLFFFAGILSERVEKPAHFTIASDDTDLDHLVGLLEGLSHTAKRVGKRKQVLAGCSAKTQSSVFAAMLRFCSHLLAHPELRPKTRKALYNALVVHNGKDGELTEAVLDEMFREKALSMSGQKMHYDMDRIAKLAAKK